MLEKRASRDSAGAARLPLKFIPADQPTDSKSSFLFFVYSGKQQLSLCGGQMSVENISSKRGREFIKSVYSVQEMRRERNDGWMQDGRPWERDEIYPSSIFSAREIIRAAPNLIKPRNSILPNAMRSAASENNNVSVCVHDIITRELFGCAAH